MNKFTKQLFIISLFLFSGSSFATLILGDLDPGDLTSNDYITYKGLDWTWASPINIGQLIRPSDNQVVNELVAPTFRDGWRFALESELEILKNELTLDDFKDGSRIIESTKYWNTNSAYHLVDANNFENDMVASQWATALTGNYQNETFYVRGPLPSVGVPEPSTLLIFSFALIALALRIRT